VALNLQVQLFVSGAWTTYPAYSEEGWTARIGPDLQSGPQPNMLSLTLNNDDLSMDPSNVASPLYGLIGRNTPMRVLINTIALFYTEASSWKPERTIEHVPSANTGRASINVTGEGMLRRIGKWDDELDSPMARQTLGYSQLLGYWPLEDDNGAQWLAQRVTASAAKPATYTGTVTLAGDAGAGGSDNVLTIGADGFVSGMFAGAGGNGFQIVFAAKLAAAPASATYETLLQFTDHLNRVWRWRANNTNFLVEITDTDAVTILASLGASYGATLLTKWIRYRLRVTVSGGTVTFEPAWYPQDNPTISGYTGTFASTATGRPRTWQILGNPWTDGAAFGHVFATNDTVTDLTTAVATAAFNGNINERAAYRWARLMGEQGLTAYVNGDPSKSTPMGRQKPGKLIDLLTECVTTEAGIMYDEPLDIAVTFRTYGDLINQAVSLALTYGTDVAPPLTKKIDDVITANDMTGSNADGTEIHLEQTTGRISTSPPPAGVGRVKGKVDTNTASISALTDRTNLELALGTQDRPRYEAVTIDLLANPGLRNAVNGLRPGHIITITGLESDVVTLRVINIEVSGGAVEHRAVLNCVPGEIWQPGKYTTVGRADSKSTTLKTTVTSGATALTFRTTDILDVWSTAGVPYDVVIAGQRNTVTAMGAAALVAGAYDQAATVTRAVNGVVKALTAGAEIHVADRARYAFGGY
jgi:hypothetical protein